MRDRFCFGRCRPVLPPALALVLSTTLPAWAVPATPEGAERITAVFQRYLGHVLGVVTVVPQGETYAVSLNAVPMLDRWKQRLAEQGGSAEDEAEDGEEAPPPDWIDRSFLDLLTFAHTPFEVTLTDNGDGTWNVEHDQPISMVAEMKGLMRREYSAQSRLSGVWDENLMMFSRSESEMTDVVQHETNNDDLGVMREGRQSIASNTGRTTATANPRGGVDQDVESEMRDFRLNETIYYSPPDENGRRDAFSIEASIGRYGVDGSATGTRWRELLALWEWGVALLEQDDAGPLPQAELADRLQATLPVFERITLRLPIEDLSVDTAFARGGFKLIDTTIDMTGVVQDSRIRVAQQIAGPDLPVMMLDPWMRPLVPQSLSYDVTLSGLDLASTVDLLLDGLRRADDAPLDEEQLQRALLPDGQLRAELAPGLIEATDYTVSYSGWITLRDGEPKAQITVEATGLDRVDRHLAAAYGTRAAESRAWLNAVRGQATRRDGRDVWNLDLDQLQELLDPPMTAPDDQPALPETHQ